MKTTNRWVLGLSVGGLLGMGVLLSGLSAAAAPLSQAQATPVPSMVPPPVTPGPVTEDLAALVAVAEAENLEWDNVSFWSQGLVGSSRFERLRIGYEVGQDLPSFEVPLFDEGTFPLGGIAQPTLINFWATWCGPCLLDLPLLLDAHADREAPFQIVMVNVWDEADAYREFVQDELPSTMLSGRGADDLPDQLGLQAIPSSVLLDGNREIMAVHIGNITPGVMAWFYALAGQTSSVSVSAEGAGGIDVPQLEVPEETFDSQALQELAVAAGQANRTLGGTTMWHGGMLGVPAGEQLVLEIGAKMPAFAFTEVDGEIFRLDLIDRPTLVNFWASWCGPCIEEFPLLVALDQNPTSRFQVVFVNVWDDAITAQQFLDDYPSDIRTLVDADGVLADLYQLAFIPVSIVVDANSRVVLIQYGPVNTAVIELIDAVLAAD